MLNALIIFGAKYLIVAPVLVAIYFVFKAKPDIRKKLLFLAAVALPSVYATAKILSFLYSDPRPFVIGHFTPLIAHAADNGFPSDHTLLAASIAAIVTCYDRKLGIALWLIAIIIGACRIAAGIHHPIDVAVSIAIAATITWLLHHYMPQKRNLR